MSLALRLFPIDRLDHDFTHTVLELGWISWEVVEEIRAVARRLPDGHNINAFGHRVPDGECQDELCYGKLTTDTNGEPYRWLPARKLIRFLDAHWPGHPVTAYVRAMRESAMIVLDFH